MLHPAIAAVCQAILILAVFSPAVAAQEAPEGTLIGEVRIEGLQATSEGFVLRSVRTRVGQPFQRSVVEDDLRTLFQTRRFLNATADSRMGADGRAVVIFRLLERPVISGVQLEGNRRFDDAELFNVLGFAVGDTADRFLVETGREAVLNKYREAGHYYAEVLLDEDLLREEFRVVLRITEGPRVRVKEIRFEGVRAFPESQLKSKLQTKTYFWILRKGVLDPDLAEQDAFEIQRFYRNEGFLDARAGYRLEFEDVERTDMTVVFVVEEGPLYRVNALRVEGAQTFEAEQLAALAELAPGDVARDELIVRAARRISDAYGEIGFVDAFVDADAVYLEEPEVVDVIIRVAEGVRSRVGRITIRGNQNTQDKVIRRELRFYPGEDFNTLKTREAERRLRELGLFSNVAILPMPDAAGEREALVEIEEGRTIDFLVGAAVSGDQGLVGQFTIDNRNFDLFNWPRTWGELFRGRAFRGAGQRLRFQAEPGTELSRFRIDFTEPYLFDKPLRFDTSLYLFQRERDAYDEQRIGLTVALSRRFETGVLDGWAVEGAVRIEDVEIDNLDRLPARDIREARGHTFLTSLKGTIVRDTTDSRLLPTEGYRFTLAWEQVGALGGDADFGRPSTGLTWYKTLATDALDRKSVLALRVDSALIVGDAPVFDRFYAGGFGSVRGFEFRGISPRAGIFNNRVGGDFILLAGGEYSFPLYSDTVRGVTFLDMGTVEKNVGINDWRAAIGFGLRINLPFFGPVPLVLDFAWPISENDRDNTRVFNFAFGASF